MAGALKELAASLDERTLNVSKVRRVVASFEGHTLEDTVVVMSIPLLYAMWEGYAKEAFALYLRCIEEERVPLSKLREELVAYIWSRELAQTQSKPLRTRRCGIVKMAFDHANLPFALPEHLSSVNTKSNLGFEMLEEICLDIGVNAPPTDLKQRLNTLVHVRNNIAHGSPPSAMRRAAFEQHAETSTLAMGTLETSISQALTMKAYLKR